MRGFSLIELLVTLTIIGIISSTAIPYYKSYQQRGFDFRAQSDLRNIALAEEAYFIDFERYISCADSGCNVLPSIKSLSPGVNLSVTVNTDSFTARASHPKGSGRTFAWDSEAGGMQ